MQGVVGKGSLRQSARLSDIVCMVRMPAYRSHRMFNTYRMKHRAAHMHMTLRLHAEDRRRLIDLFVLGRERRCACSHLVC